MAILVTGGAGYIGSHTALLLLENNYEVVVVDNLSNSCEESLKRVKELTGKTLKFYKEDINNFIDPSIKDKPFMIYGNTKYLNGISPVYKLWIEKCNDPNIEEFKKYSVIKGSVNQF